MKRFYPLFFLISSIIVAQEKIYTHIQSLPINDSIKSLKIDSLLAQNINQQKFLAVDIVGNKYANWHYKNERVSSSIEALLLSIEYHQGDAKYLQRKYYKLGQFYAQLKNKAESIKAYKEVVKIDADPVRTARACTLLGYSYFENGDYHKSQQYYEIAEKKFRKEKQLDRLVNNHINSSNTYSRINTKTAQKKIIKNLLEADSISKVTPIPLNIILKIKKSLLSYYVDYETRNTELGEKYGLETLQIAKQLQDSLEISGTYNLLGTLYDHSAPKKGISYNEKALLFNTQSKYIRSISYASIGLCNSKLKNYEKSISNFHIALELITEFDFKTHNTKVIEKVLNQYFDKDNNLWVIINNLAEVHLLKYERDQDIYSLEKSIRFFRIADKIIDLYNQNTDETNTKLIWRRKATELYGRALKATFLSKRIDIAHLFMEKNKALLLYEENNKRQQLQNIKLNQNVVDRKSTLQKKILILEKSKSLSEDKKISLLKYKQTLKKLLDSIQTISPDNLSLKKTYTPKSIPEIQASLDTNEVILEYHINIDEGYGIYPNTDKTYLICISKEKEYLLEINTPKNFKRSIQQLCQKQLKPFRNDQDILEYTTESFKIYKTLFPVEIREIIRDKELTIIPDNYLSTIPFESLVVSEKKSNDYLINYHQISYKYSYTFHDQNKNNLELSDQNYAAFAPVYFNDLVLPELEESKAEVTSLHQYFNGQIFLEEKATKQSFLDILEKTSIIHLATHADANDSIAPWIAFSDQKMFLNELSISPNSASLVVLSACNTTNGKIETGEGVMSLARGFFYGGAQTTISSLWNVDDKSSQFIFKDFYSNLNQGASKSKALHMAKINYLKNHVGSEASPYYWASLVLIGDTSSLQKSNWITVLSTMCISGILIVLILYIKKKSIINW
ncbi:CHAT domain-containing protein [Aquimarina rubra]|uniref:CHAT domain-containing protein n=1 Tax=Aquimarina rubra TaxID=1920033 RepID=A0ABW5LBZ6_9FLAO